MMFFLPVHDVRMSFDRPLGNALYPRWFYCSRLLESSNNNNRAARDHSSTSTLLYPETGWMNAPTDSEILETETEECRLDIRTDTLWMIQSLNPLLTGWLADDIRRILPPFSIFCLSSSVPSLLPAIFVSWIIIHHHVLFGITSISWKFTSSWLSRMMKRHPLTLPPSLPVCSLHRSHNTLCYTNRKD